MFHFLISLKNVQIFKENVKCKTYLYIKRETLFTGIVKFFSS